MVREALTYPIRGETAEETMLVGTVLALAAGLLARSGVGAVVAAIPTVLLVGYAQTVLRASVESAGGTAAGGDVPPPFTDFRALAVDGLRALVVAAGYLFVPAVALAVTVGGASGDGRAAPLGTTVFVLGAGTVVLFVSATFAYLLPAALASVARTGTIRAAFDRSRLRRHAGNGGYFVGWIAALVVGGLAVVFLGAATSLGRPGEVVALGGSFYALVVVARLLGRGLA